MAKSVTNYINTRDLKIDDLLLGIFDSLTVPSNNVSAAELAKLWKDQVKEKISSMSLTLAHRVSPLVQILIDKKIKEVMDTEFIRITPKIPDLKDAVDNYNSLIGAWFNDMDEHISYAVTNPLLLGNLSKKDMFMLTYFAFLTCHRTQGDNLLQLGLVGISSCAKSTLFEAPLLEGAHVTTNEAGVGRFQVNDKPILMFHDVNIKTLVEGKDVDKIKTIARTEPTVSKIHSSTVTLPHLFLFYSSNQRLMYHEFEPSPSHRFRLFPSQATESASKPVPKEHLVAVQNRFIEAYVRSRPSLDLRLFPKSGCFSRHHAILGIYPHVLDVLKKYKKEDFHSVCLLQYVISGLCKNAKMYGELENVDPKKTMHQIVETYLPSCYHHDVLNLL